MKKVKSQIKFLKRETFVLVFFLFICAFPCFSQDNDLEFTLDVNSETIPLPKIFKPNIDFSGRGFSRQSIWPQELAAQEVLDTWQQDIGFKGIFRLQYNLWEVNEFAKNKNLQNKLLANYEGIMQKVTQAGGVVIVNIFGTPAGMGRVLDKKSPPLDLKAYKQLVKNNIRHLSCEKKFNLWYEVWNAPDLDDFFLGRKQEYLFLYRVVAEAVEELEKENKIHIPIGGPSASWWFQNFDGNNIITAERSLIYELIKFCSNYHLPLDFISWHAYSTDPKTEKGLTTYNKTAIKLIKTWLSYFHLNSNIPLIIDEWNYDSGANLLAARADHANICAAFILSRIQNMSEAGLDDQVYFSLEDFQNNKENITSNLGVFWFDPEAAEYKGEAKVIYNVFQILNSLGQRMFTPAKLDSEFVGVIATKLKGGINILIYNYIDPQIAVNFLSRNIATFNSAERKVLLNLVRSGELSQIFEQEKNVSGLRLSNKVKAALKKALELNHQAKKFQETAQNIKINLKNLKGDYTYQRYSLDSSCTRDCKFLPVEEKEVSLSDTDQEILALNPYSVTMLTLQEKPKEPVAETKAQESGK